MRKESCAKMNRNPSRGRRWLREMPETDFEWRWSGENRYQLVGSFLGAWLEELFSSVSAMLLLLLLRKQVIQNNRYGIDIFANVLLMKLP